MKNNLKKKIVISAVNLTEGGGREVLLSCLRVVSLDPRFIAIAIVNNKAKKDLVRSANIKYLQVPFAKKSWLYRIIYEYFFSKSISKKINPDIWFSLHDVTPNVVAKKRYVYCHNIAPFFKFRLRDVRLDPRFSMFVLFYKWIYRINLHKNNAVFVQQKWIADKFLEFFKYTNCVVAVPEEKSKNISKEHSIKKNKPSKVIFFYPTLPRTYKNLEIIFEAVDILKRKNVLDFKVIITVSKNENKYINFLVNKYGIPNQIELCGRLDKDQMNKFYLKSDILLFPSKLETWGLPIREAMSYNLPTLLASHPYAKATSNGYDKVCFFDMESPEHLSSFMSEIVVNNNYTIFQDNYDNFINKEELKNWKDLLNYIYKN